MKKTRPNSTLACNLIQLLRNRAEAEPSARAYVWLIDGEREGAALSRADLEERARIMGTKLHCLTPKAESALLLFPPGLQFIEALFGCWYTGIIAIPAYVPRSNHDLVRIEGMLRDSGCTIALTLREIAPYVQKAISAINPKIEILAIEELVEKETKCGIDPQPQCREIAYLQYTSGSTASPKGVIVTHSNVLENLKYIQSQGGFSEASLSVNWLPHFHDMGLIYGILQPLFTGFTSVCFAPSAFTHKPSRWLSAITRYRGTHCGGPNFAYDLCVERVTREECASLDLSCWQVAFNGAEPIRSETLKRFTNYFSAAGFRSQAFYPVYGLAEATLKVTSGAPGAGPKYCSVDSVEIGKHKVRVVDPESKSASTIVGCGRWHAPHEVAIVNPETKEVCPTDEVGEVWVSGPSVAAGYWRNEVATQHAFGSFSRSGKGPFLRTGDLGFVYRHELFITGRLKDCIIVRGRNHYPQDIEESVEESHPALRRNGSAAFCVEQDGHEKVVVVGQVKRQFKGNLDEVIDTIREAIAENHELQAFAIVLVKTGGLPKTSSGKVQRQLCKALFSENKLPVLRQSILDDCGESENEGVRIQRDSLLAMDTGNRRAALRTYIRHAVARVLRRPFDHTSGNCELASLGFDSLMLAELKHTIEAELAISLSLETLLGADIDGIAEDMLGQVETTSYSTDGMGLLKRVRDRKYAPASYSQEQIWLIQELFPETSAYNLPVALCLRGELNAAVLKRSLDEIWARHEGLRSVFVAEEGELRVTLLPVERGVLLLEHDLRRMGDAEAKLKELMMVEAQAPFDLKRGPLIRAHVVRMEEQEHVLLLTQHHIVSDGWSMGILARELGTLYGAFSRGEENPLEPLRIQYADYAAWQREWLSGERLQKQSEYWREALAEAPALLELPTDRPRPEQQSFAGGCVPVVIERELAPRLKELSRRQGTTLFMTLLGAWAAVLGRLSGQQEVVIGTPVANRRRAETEGLIGFFVNMLALRIDLSDEPSVAEMLKRVNGVVLGAQEHQDVPFEQVVEMVQSPRHLNHTRIFQVVFSWQNQEWSLPQLPGLKVERLRMPYEAAKFDLQLDLAEQGGRIVGGVNYAVALFDEVTIKRQVGYLMAMLEGMAADQKQEVAGIDVLEEEERKLLLEEWNATEAEYPEDVCIHELFEEQVRRTPGAIALVHEEQSLSYGELNRRANQLAHYLRSQGVAPDARVGICVERGVKMVVGLLAVLKAGGGYVPLDPAYPAERLKYMLQDSAPVVLLTEKHLWETLGGMDGTVRAINIEEEEGKWSRKRESNPERSGIGLRPEHLAYVIYTSGSTGYPKGVMVEHRNVTRLFTATSPWFEFGASDIWTLFHSYGFDFSVWEMWGALIYGGRLIVVPKNITRSPDDFYKLICEKKVTVLSQTPSAFRQLVIAQKTANQEHQLRYVIFGGEALEVSTLRPWYKQNQGRRTQLVNMYGITETTVHVTYRALQQADTQRTGWSPIGCRIPDLRTYILDEKRNPVPVGVIGELYIGGAGVARGYLNQAELTAERFLKDPFVGDVEARMYRTGDLGRWLADGTLEFIGRNDFQVKIRGFRIELGEIEARLAEHDLVQEAVVVAREDGGREKRLVAYVVAREERDAGRLAAILRTHLAGILPDYMVPAAFVSLEKLPLTPNGKLNRKALSAPEGEAYAQRSYEAPQGEIEESLANLWQQLLRVERVGRQDHFFELGGHSLLVVRLQARIWKVLGVELPVATLFARPTLERLAEAVREAGREGKQEGLAPMVRIARVGAMPLSFAQQRLWFLGQMEGVSVSYHIPAALRLRGALDRGALKRSLDEIWARHESLRSVFVVEEGEPRVELLPAERGLLLEEHDLRGMGDAEAKLKELMMVEAQAPFDLKRGPLIRSHLVRMEEQEHVLLVTQHHIVSDGWSMGILARELGTLYGAFSRGGENPLEPLAIQYADYAAWQREWLMGERLEKQSEYWREALAEAPVLLELPTDRLRPEQQSFAGGGVPIRMDRELTRKLRKLSHGNGTTLYMTLLGAWAAVLSRLSGQSEVVIGTPVANRRRAETEGLIGFFVNTLALRIDLRGEPSVAEMLKRVKGVMLGAQEHQDVPFEQVVEMVQPPRHLNHTPVFQVMFSWQNQEWSLPQMPGVKVEKEESDYGFIKFDVELELREEKEGIAGALRYATALFEEGTIRRQAGYLMAMLEAMVTDSQQEVGEIGLLGMEERKQLLEEWNATEACYPDLCIHELFEAQVRRTPEATALVYEEQRLSYEELNRQANQLAHYLIGLGVKPDERVGICVERGVGMVVGLLGILKAGGAYVPLDPDYPDKRLAYMLEDTQAAFVLTQAKLEEKLMGLLPVATRLITLDRQWDEISERVAEWKTQNVELKQNVNPHSLVYVIYTSGSTGLSKGVMVEHQSVVNLFFGLKNSVYDADKTDGIRVSVNGPLTFDTSVKQVIQLLAGHVLYIVPEPVRRDTEALLRFIYERKIEVFDCTPSQLRLLLEAGLAQERSDGSKWGRSLQGVLVGGERIDESMWTMLAKSGIRFFNAYGPTECTVDATIGAVRSDDEVPHIGRPIANTKIYLLDGKQRPVPQGAVGEIYIGGAGVARGYLNRPELTAERFVRDPFTRAGEGRMYKTGDLGRYLGDGNIEFLGRNDQQVKIRGFRIELGEIEARLAEHDVVREAVVVAREDEKGEKRLVAYVVPVHEKGEEGGEGVWQQGEEIDRGNLAGVLRTYLGERLPEYMVPAAYVQLEELPLTPNGKLDRKALPTPEGEAYGQNGYEEPQGEIEEALAGMWQELLGVERVGRQDQFFELGGHSLLAVRLQARIWKVFGVELPMTVLFVRPRLEQLAKGVREAGAEGKEEALEPMVAISRQGAMPLSFAQQRLWFLAQMEGVSVTYHIPAALRLRGELDVEALKRSLDGIWARHEGLRSVFVVKEGEPRVELLPVEMGVPLLEHDLRGAVDADERLQGLMVEEANAGFDLARGPLIRAHLVRMQEEEHVLLLTQHHIVSDGWSMGILARELGALYGAFSRGEENPLPPLGTQYPDYAAWQREWLSGERLQKQSEYWREALADAPALLELPTDRPRPEQQSFTGGCVPICMDRDLTRRLRELSQGYGTTLYMTLLGAWAAVLSRLSGQAEVVIGTPVANRRRAETEGLIGFFVNTLALRIDLRGEPSVGEMLKRVRSVVLGAQEHQDVPFEQVVEMVQPPRHLNRTPIFQVMFAWHNQEWGLPQLPGVRVERDESDYQVIKFDVELDLREEKEGIAGMLRYATALFDEATIKRQTGYLMAMLEGMAADQEQEIVGIDLLEAEERKLLLEEWNATEAEYPEDRCIHELFEEQVRRTPEATALVYEEQSLSYEELNQQANQLAHYLIGLGVKPEERVGICVERGVGMVVGLLGILKAGGAYVPLDPAYPFQRLREIVDDAGPRMVLIDAAGRQTTGADALKNVTVIDVGELGRREAQPPVWAEQPCSDPEAQTLGLTSRHLAYVIYTSGSTGKPKGVAIEHRNAANLLCWARKNFAVEETRHTLFSTSLQFDLSIYECFVPLICGGTVHVVADALSLIHQPQPVSLVNTVPSAMASVLEHEGLPCSTRTVNLAGEPLKAGLIRRLLEQSQVGRVCNLYGPTETTTYSTWISMERGGEVLESIGRPIANTKIYLLDGKQRLVPLGAVGEIYIGGAGVARGYLNRPELTAERFVRDPFTTVGDGRMYKTGDVGRYLGDGNIKFLGRNDQQVKIRGFRIELGEIEARLAEHDSVREAVVVAREDEKGEKRLVAYVVAREETDAGEMAAILRAHLVGILPEYMVPRAIVRLEALPLTPNGKLDRKALPEPEGEAYGQHGYEEPQGEIEEALAAMWKELLGVERVGRQDGFFEMGGHSLLAMRLIARVQQLLGVELPVGTLFARPMLAHLAEAVREAGAEGKEEALEPMVAISRQGAMPLSFAQQRLWFLAQMEGVSVTYHIPVALRLRGELDKEALKRSLDGIWARHEGLRSVFVAVEGEPRVELLPLEMGLPLLEHDLRGIGDAETQLKELMMMETQAPFDLKRGPLIRSRLVRMEEEHVLLLTQHHIVSDGWSIGILARELGALYGAFSRAEENPLPPLGIQYADYAAWQREWLSGERLQKQSEYWREALADAPALLELPTDRPRPEQQSFTGGSVPICMDRDLTRRLRELSQGYGTTLYMTLLGAWAAVLSRLSGQAEVVIGTPVANRRRAETEGLIGFFVNTLALRIDLRGEPSVGEMLKRVRGVVLGAQEHQDVPFEHVVEIVQPPRHLNRTPIFQVMFAWHNQEWGLPQLPGVRVERDESDYQVIKFDVELDLREEKEGIAGTLRYATALFDEATIKRQAGYLLAMLKAMAAEQKQAVCEIDLLSPDERRLLLETWNATEVEYPKHLCVHQLFEQQAKRSSEAVAVVCENQCLSYAELNMEANRLAHHLINLGVKPRDPVAICVERGVGMVVGLLAILKAGGAYVPLDSAYPSQRLKQILADAHPAILLSDSTGLGALGWDILSELMVVDLDMSEQSEALPPVWAEQPAVNPDAQALGLTSHDLAYVMYTSGSTGTPKGVMVPHRAITRLVLGSNFIRFSPEEVFLQLAPVSFDAATFEIWGALLHGAKLALIAGNKVSPEEMGEAIRKYGVTTMWLTAALFHFITAEHVLQLAPLRQLLAGGDVLSVRHVRKVLDALPHLQLVNGYGPTENTTFTCCHTITLDSLERGSIPIGRPISNTKVYILDDHLLPVPLGAVGELYAGGVGVACGYLNRPDLTAERFLADPFDGAHERMYRTGDLARYLPDGSIEFLGRNDQQVKIRGFRIELEEIEARLTEHDLVREAVVVAREGGNGEKRLVAYVVAREEMEVGELAAILRTHLAGLLPEYMVPAAFVSLKKLPLTPSGKLDRKALPGPEGEAYALRTYEPPQGEIENGLATLWQELLGVRRVGRQDRFFELGGHSLLAVRLQARIWKVFGVELPMTVLFAQSTVERLAEAVREARAEGKQEALEPIVPISRVGAMPLSFAQQRLWFLAQMEGVSVTYHIPVALRLRGELDKEALKRSLDGIWARHEGLRSVFVAVEGEPRVELLPLEMGLPLLEHDLRGIGDAETQLKELMMMETQAPFDLKRGPLIRSRLVRMEEEHVLLLTQHHIVSDGWSIGILARELGALYGAFHRQQPSLLPELPVQYVDYAAWQREWLSGERLQKQSEYWREALGDAPALLELPTDRPRREQQSFTGGCVPICMDRDLTRRLRELSHGNGTTLYMTLLGAWAAVLSRLSGQAEVVIGTPVANRRRAETEGLIGFFVNTLALRVDLRGEPSVAEMLKRVKGVVLGAQEHQDVPFEQVVEMVKPPRHLNHTPIFQVMFAWQNQERMMPELVGVQVSLVDLTYEVAKFDLQLDLAEEGEMILGTLRYATALFDEATIKRQRGYLMAMLEAMVAEQKQEVGEIDLLSSEERKLLLETWNATEAEYAER